MVFVVLKEFSRFIQDQEDLADRVRRPKFVLGLTDIRVCLVFNKSLGYGSASNHRAQTLS